MDPALQARLEAAFDRDFYLKRNPDVAAAGLDPLAHFLRHGWREGRDPSPEFQIADYLALNPDVEQSGRNPFVHYLEAGECEGRSRRPDLGFRYEILLRLQPLDDRLKRHDGQLRTKAPDPSSRLTERLAGAVDLHLTVSHDDFTAHLGGLQLCLRREAAKIAQLGLDHLHLYPATPYPTLRDGRPPEQLGVLWNGEHLGVFAAEQIAQAFSAAPRRGRRRFALHSLLGHVVDDVLAILAAGDMREGVFWLHDYASLCAGFHLLRDDVADCGAPPPGSAACMLCVYGPHRERHMTAFRRLFEGLSLTIAAPSHSAMETWRSASDLPFADHVILPHARLTRPRPASAAPDGPLRVAFAGFPVAHKGWRIFEGLAAQFEADQRYRFIHVGSSDTGRIEFHPADGEISQRLAELEADVVLAWPLCRETFGLVAYEAVAAGATLLTHKDSGNVADLVAAEGYGQVMADETELAEAFETGDVLRLSRRRRQASIYDLEFGALTAELYLKERGIQAAASS